MPDFVRTSMYQSDMFSDFLVTPFLSKVWFIFFAPGLKIDKDKKETAERNGEEGGGLERGGEDIGAGGLRRGSLRRQTGLEVAKVVEAELAKKTEQ